MDLVKWQEEYSVHVDAIDEQHKRFLAIINKLAQVQATDRDAVGIAMDDLLDYAAYHFAAEERILATRPQVDLAEHRKRHNVFINRMVLLKRDFNTGKDIDPTEVFDWAGAWLLHHILRRDKRYLTASPPPPAAT